MNLHDFNQQATKRDDEERRADRAAITIMSIPPATCGGAGIAWPEGRRNSERPADLRMGLSGAIQRPLDETPKP